MLDFAKLRDTNVRRCIFGFHHRLDAWSIAEWTNAMCGEAGEAANVAKKLIRHRDNLPGNQGEDTDIASLRHKLGNELADVVLYADLCAAAIGVSLEEYVISKFNVTSDKLNSLEKL